ncbi:hypothetical protein Tco_1139361, partial [Tanacetum coccineum]
MQCNTTGDAYQFSDELEMSLVEHPELFTPHPDEAMLSIRNHPLSPTPLLQADVERHEAQTVIAQRVGFTRN